MTVTVRKAVIPCAGFGTRFLPATRSIPKVMVPVLDRPVVHFAVEEAVQAGIEHIVLVISRGQEAICQYFDRMPDLEEALERRGNQGMLKQMLDIADMADISYVYQKQQLGLGHAVLAARAAVGRESFAVFLPDDLIWTEDPTIGRMIEMYAEYGGTIIAVKEVPDEAVSSLGIVDVTPMDGRVSRIVGMVEKPSVDEAPSNLSIVGRYVLTAEIFDALESAPPGALGEIQLTDAIRTLLSTQSAFAYKFPGPHFDVGTPLGLLRASTYAALSRGDVSGEFREWVAGVL